MSLGQPAEITFSLMREHLYTAVVSDALDALGFRHQSPGIQLQQLTGEGLLVGRCKTTLWEDMTEEDLSPYELELRAVDECRPDDVIIAAAGGSMKSGIWGELLTTAARNAGCVGAIVDGAARDVKQLSASLFPVFALGTCARDSLHRQRVSRVDVAVSIGGVTFHPGDLVFADQDGVVVVPREVEAQAVRRAWEKVHAENVTRDAIRAGMKATDAYQRYGIL